MCFIRTEVAQPWLNQLKDHARANEEIKHLK
jgi:hypothetical protein